MLEAGIRAVASGNLACGLYGGNLVGGLYSVNLAEWLVQVARTGCVPPAVDGRNLFACPLTLPGWQVLAAFLLPTYTSSMARHGKGHCCQYVATQI